MTRNSFLQMCLLVGAFNACSPAPKPEAATKPPLADAEPTSPVAEPAREAEPADQLSSGSETIIRIYAAGLFEGKLNECTEFELMPAGPVSEDERSTMQQKLADAAETTPTFLERSCADSFKQTPIATCKTAKDSQKGRLTVRGHFYDAAGLKQYESECTAAGGVWTLSP